MFRKFIISLLAILPLNAAWAQFEDELLPAEEAFALNAIINGDELVTSWTIADGYYMYRDKFALASQTAGVALGEMSLPPGEQIDDPLFGSVTIYTEHVEIRTPILTDVSLRSARLQIAGQGCNKPIGICYPPIINDVTLPLPSFIASAQASEPPQGEMPDASPSGDSGGTLWLIISAFGIGLLLTFTPCVLPMIPIVSSIIAGEGGQASRLRGGALSSVYVLGTVVSYAFIGYVAGATGDQLNAYFQNAWVIGAIVTVLALMSLSMFGLFEIKMPSYIENRIVAKSAGLGGGKAGAVFVLGMLSALVVSACVSPLLISALGVAIAKGDPLLGAGMMTSMALGMGAVLIAIGFGLGAALPKAGAWMERVRQVFGVLLLAVAIYLLGFIPEVPVLALWGALLIVCGVYLGATQALPEGVAGWRYLWKGAGTVMLIWGVLAMIGTMFGGRDILRPLPSLATATTSLTGGSSLVANAKYPFETVERIEVFEQRLAQADSSGKPVIIDFYADWCLDCLRLQNTTYRDAGVVSAINDDFVALKIDLTDPNDQFSRSIRKRYGIFGPPALVIVGEANDHRIQYGYMDRQEMLVFLRST